MKPNLSHPKQELISLGLFLVIIAVIVIHSWQDVLLPVLGHEDGRDMLAFYFNDGSPWGILRYYGGYVSLVPNAIGWFATRLPLPLSPYVFTLASIIIATTGFHLLSRKGHAWLMPETSTRFIIVLTMAILSLGKGYMVNNLTYSQWNLFFLLIVLLTRWPLPLSIGGLSAWAVSVVLCAASHPLSILVLPLCAVQFALNQHRSQRLFIVFCTCAIVAYQALGVKHTADITPSFYSTLWALKVFLARVSFESVFGAHATTLLTTNAGAPYVYAFGVMVLCMTAFMVLSGPRPRRDASIAVSMLLLAFAIVAVSTLVRFVGPGKNLIYLKHPHLQRYFYIPKLILSLLVLWQLVPRIQGALRRHHTIAKAALLGGCCVYIVSTTWDNRFLYGGSQMDGRRVRDFLDSAYGDLRRAEQGKPYQSQHTLERNGPWDIVLIIQSHTNK